jgi:hypothetical protein
VDACPPVWVVCVSPCRRTQLKNMSPEELQRQMNGVQTQAAGTQQYMFNVRTRLLACLVCLQSRAPPDSQLLPPACAAYRRLKD